MVFGRIKAARRKRKEKAILNAQREKDWEAINNQGLPSKEETDEIQNRANEMADAESARQNQKRQGFKQEAQEDLNTPMQGLTPAQKLAMQETASNQINKQLQNYSRMASSKMGAAGVRGGAANAVQSELMGQGLEATNQFNRDLTEKDADLAMQKLAAYLSSVEGKQAQDILTRQQQYDLLSGEKQKKKENATTNYFNKYKKV